MTAAEIDPRFDGDKEFPNEWSPLSRDGGAARRRPAAAWSGAGFYLKVTRLAAPPGAVFGSSTSSSPSRLGWFGGANLLRSKLPIAVQTVVRNMRREWVKGK